MNQEFGLFRIYPMLTGLSAFSMALLTCLSLAIVPAILFALLALLLVLFMAGYWGKLAFSVLKLVSNQRQVFPRSECWPFDLILDLH